MGEWIKPRNMRWDDRTEERIARIQRALDPMCPSRSSAVRWSIAFTDDVLSTPGILPRVAEAFQGASCAQFVRTRPAEKPGPYYWRGIAPTENEARDFIRAIYGAAA